MAMKDLLYDYLKPRDKFNGYKIEFKIDFYFT